MDIKKKILNNRGVTGIDLVTSIIILTMFSGFIITLMSNIYKNSIEIQKSANAMSYATIILEKVDEKAFDTIENDFVTSLINNGEVKIDEGYNIKFSTKVEKAELLKKVDLTVEYDVSGKSKSITLTKYKIKEISK